MPTPQASCKSWITLIDLSSSGHHRQNLRLKSLVVGLVVVVVWVVVVIVVAIGEKDGGKESICSSPKYSA